MKRAFFLFSLLMFATGAGWAQKSDTLNLLNDIQLQNEKWYYDLDSALADPDKVYKLSVTDKKIKRLPAEIGSLKNLQTLTLTHCKIKELPPEIGKLYKLQRLNLYRNKLRYLPEGMRKLEVLYLGRNHLANIPMWVGGLGSLRRLDISRNRLTNFETTNLKSLLPKVDITY